MGKRNTVLDTGKKLFTSESVANGHPDKIADQISDAVVDDALRQDPHARVACETMVKTGLILVAGEMSTSAWINVEKIARSVVRKIGYVDPLWGFDADSCAVITSIGSQSADIAQGVDRQEAEQQGAGDQGLMFGYASDETDALMPAPIEYAHRLMRQHAHIRDEGIETGLGPDAKTQLTFIYDGHDIVGIDTVVLSTQHRAYMTLEDVRGIVKKQIIEPILPQKWLSDQTRYFINPTGRFVIGGPIADCGLTGRKIIVDTYGGMARHGGGCFSGKDPSKVDRSAAYLARFLAKNVVSAGFAKKCEIQLAYAIGIAEPVSVRVDAFGTETLPTAHIEKALKNICDMTPWGIIQRFDLKKPMYQKTATFGHFGSYQEDMPWESLALVPELTDAVHQVES